MQPKTYLFVLWVGGGNVPSILGIAKRTIAGGHKGDILENRIQKFRIKSR